VSTKNEAEAAAPRAAPKGKVGGQSQKNGSGTEKSDGVWIATMRRKHKEWTDTKVDDERGVIRRVGVERKVSKRGRCVRGVPES